MVMVPTFGLIFYLKILDNNKKCILPSHVYKYIKESGYAIVLADKVKFIKQTDNIIKENLKME